ncbi:hypothetical protein AB205_0072530 [Aquarana catesbeiana]|uniref:Uncharacterized protein n=1 Tax=Aquarana catesbeiana TaxID=8400 RepID=A0A2G9SJ37_AQUCT|nr:hypothetical protein AB205_0072530 [Aquarana catesbeiana]
MGPVKCLLLAAVCIQVSSMPLSTQLSEEEEKVTRCIMEVLAESLSKQGPERVSSGCIRLLREGHVSFYFSLPFHIQSHNASFTIPILNVYQ